MGMKISVAGEFLRIEKLKFFFTYKSQFLKSAITSKLHKEDDLEKKLMKLDTSFLPLDNMDFGCAFRN